MSSKISGTTQALLNSIMQGDELTPAVRVDFGIDSPLHFAAISDAVLSGKVDAQELDAALGSGPKLTEIVGRVADNPYHDLEFQTAWDAILQRGKQAELAIERGERER